MDVNKFILLVFMELVVKQETLFKEPYSTITHDSSLQLIIIISQGYQTFEQIKHAFNHALQAIKAKKATKILVDNTEVKGTFTQATEWVASSFIPEVIKAGVTLVASIPSQDVFGKYAGTQTLSKINGVSLQRFSHRQQALEWLKAH